MFLSFGMIISRCMTISFLFDCHTLTLVQVDYKCKSTHVSSPEGRKSNAGTNPHSTFAYKVLGCTLSMVYELLRNRAARAIDSRQQTMRVW